MGDPVTLLRPAGVRPPLRLAAAEPTRDGAAPLDSAEPASPNPFVTAREPRPTLADAVAAVASLRPLEGASGAYELVHLGQRHVLSAKDAAALTAVATGALARAADRIATGLDGDLSAYRAQRDVDRDQPIAAAVSRTLGGVGRLPARLESAAAAAHEDLAEARLALAAGDLVRAADVLEGAELAAGVVAQTWREYSGGLVDGAGHAVRGLEHTRTAAFVTLGVLSIVGTGGLAGGAAATAKFAAASQGITAGASILATTGQAAATAALGDAVDLGKLAKDVAADLVLARFGGQLSNAMFRRLVGHPAVRSLGEVAFARVATSVLTHEAGTALRTAVDAAYAKLSGQDVTWDRFVDELATRLTDPTGLAIAAVMGAVQAGADVRYAAAKSTLVVDPGKKNGQNNELDLVRNRQIVEDKSAHNLDNPANVKPQTPDAWAEKQIFKKTSQKLDLLASASAVTRPHEQGSADVPTMDQLRGVRQYRFDIEADTPGLRAAVEKQMDALRTKYPDWTFSARFGVTRPADDRAP